ncbi:peptidase inhibitor family I36 protein [Streptomyces omiyaensis]|uniref:peptidase inhibitor family I36 protein n=1 Tax=Streptomyces omiyaensis TaxID=68247 RepID=UPI0036FD5C41
MTVTVYADVDYQGKSATLGAGRHKLDPSMDDLISSVRVPDGWSATLYEHSDFTGRHITLHTDTRKLQGDLNDKASAIVITHPTPHDQNARDDFDEDGEDDFIVFQS